MALSNGVSTPLSTAAPSPGKLVARGKFPIVDFDGDRISDLAFTAVERPGEQCQQEPSGKICWRPNTPSRMLLLVFLGRDRGALSQTVELATGPDELAMSRAYEVGAVGDLDGDGRTEIAITFHPHGGRGAETLLLLRGTQRGLSDPYQSVPLPKVESHYWYSIRARPAGDVDGDGHPDVVLGPAILHGGAGGKIRDVELVKPPGYSQYELVMTYPVGDVTGDKIADVVTVQKQTVYLVPGGGKSAPVKLAMAPSNAFDAADLDGDGKAELISISPRSPLRLSTFTLSATGATPGPKIDIPGDEVHGFVAADTDGSGIRDLHVVVSVGRVDVPCGTKCTGPANLHVRRVRGGSTLSLDPRPPSPATVSLGSGPSIYLRSLGDLDGDGIEELGIVTGSTLRATRSRGGTFELAGRFSSTPKQIDVYTARAN